MGRAFFLLIFAVAVDAQTLSWTGAPAAITSGTPFTVSLQASAPSAGWGALSFDPAVSGGAITAVVLSPALTAAGEFLTCNSALSICIVIPASATAIDATIPVITTAGPVATLTITPSASSVSLSLTNGQMVSPAGIAIATTLPRPLPIPDKCAVTGDGAPSLADFAEQLSWSLGIATPPAGGPPAARIASDTTLPYLQSAMIVAAAVITGVCAATQ